MCEDAAEFGEPFGESVREGSIERSGSSAVDSSVGDGERNLSEQKRIPDPAHRPAEDGCRVHAGFAGV